VYCLGYGNRAPASICPWGINGLKCWLLFLVTVVMLLSPSMLNAMTAKEILDQVEKQSFSENFRVAITIKSFKGKKTIADTILWAMGRPEASKISFFVDFEEPKDSKGLRFLFQTEKGKEPRAFMFLPVTGKTVPLGLDDSSVDIGGTGLSLEDLLGFIPKPGETESILKEEKSDDRDCYVIGIDMANGKGKRQLWITKDGYFLLKSQQIDPQGNVVRTFRVTQFFKTDQGKDFPREEEITIPAKGGRILVRQENAVFGIEIPAEVTDPEKFGTFQWKR
jgi:hypothetical protein